MSARCLNPLETAPRADRIGVIRLGALGDVARTLPAVAALRRQHPASHITWVVEPASAGLLEGQPWCDEVLVFPRDALVRALRGGRLAAASQEAAAFAGALRHHRFDLVIDFHAILKSGILALWSGAPLRATYARGHARELAWMFGNRHARLEPDSMSRFERNAALVAFLGVDPGLAPRHPLRVLDASAARIETLTADTPGYAVLHPGTSPATPYKRYPAGDHAEVARGLREELGLVSLVTRGRGAEEAELARAIVAASDGAARLAPETRSVQDLAALFARARVFVGSDSGPLHVASLVGTPVVQILGPTDPVENAPYQGTPSRSLRVPLACSPCRRGCAAATCMRSVSPPSVVAAVAELVGGLAAATSAAR